MNPNLTFTPIQLETWPRGQVFYYFSKMAPTGYAMTVEVEVTQMRQALKAAGMKFFPAYLWLVTKTLNEQQEFKIAEVEGQLGYYETLTPLYAAFHDDDKNFSLMWTTYDEDFLAFYQAYLEDQKTYGHQHGILAKGDNCRRPTPIPSPASLGSPSSISLSTPMRVNPITSPRWRLASSLKGKGRPICPCPSPATTPPPTGIT